MPATSLMLMPSAVRVCWMPGPASMRYSRPWKQMMLPMHGRVTSQPSPSPMWMTEKYSRRSAWKPSW